MTVVDPHDPRARRTIWKEALLVAVVVAIVAAVRACGRAGEAGEERQGSSPNQTNAAAAPPASVANGGPAADRVVADVDPSAPAPNDPAVGRVAEIGPVDGLEVRVVDDVTGEPVPDVEVGFESRRDRWPDRSLLWKDPAAARRKATGLYRADGSGVARVPWPGEAVASTIVWCLDAGRRTCVSIGSFTPTPIELRVRAARSLAVRVVDAAGAPVEGAPVAFGEADESDEIDWSDESRVETGANGTAEVRGLDLLGPAATERRRIVGVPLVVGPTPFEQFDAARPPADPITLVLPPVGTVRFHVVDGAGNEVHADGDVNVMRAIAESEVESDRQQRADIRDGIGNLEFVPIGFRFYALPTAPRLVSRELWFDGPRASGEVVRIELVSGGGGPWLVGRVVDAAGAPVVNARLDVEVDAPSGSLLEEIRSDSLGRFRSDARWLERDGEQRTLTVIWTRDDGSSSQLSTNALPDRLPDGEFDVGDVVLESRDVLVRGRVVDERGEAVTGADVRAEFDHPLSWAAQASLGFAARSGAGVPTRTDGSFTLFGNRDLGDGDLVASRSEGAPSSPVPFRAGDLDVRIELPRPGRIVGRILADQALDGRGLELRLRRSEGVETGNTSTYFVDMSDGRFTIAAVPAGSWTFELAAIDGEETELLATVPDVRVLAGEVTRDARLDPLDLRGRIHVVQVDVAHPDPSPNSETTVRLFAPRESAPLRSASGRQRSFCFVVSVPEVTVDVWAPRCRHVIRERVRGTTRIELVRGTTVPLKVRLARPELVKLVASERDATWFIVSCVPEGSESTMELRWLSQLAEDAPIDFELPDVGRWEVRARLVARRDGREHAVDFDPGPLLLDARDSTPLDVPLPITFDALRAAFDELASAR